MDEDFEGGSTSLSALMNNNPPPMNTLDICQKIL